MSLKGKVCVITGASRGIGRCCALAFAKEGCNVAVAAKSIEEKPNLPGTVFSVAKEVEALGVEALAVQCNVLDENSVKQMVNKVVAKWGRVDILLNNAGALWWKKMVDTPMKRYDLINGVNSRGTFMCTKYCLPHMLKNGWGHIINMSPPIDLGMLDGKIGYCISKFGMTLIAHGIAKEYQGSGVACNALWPATMIESFATKNFQMGVPSMWRKAEIIADASVLVCKEDPVSFSGHALIDEDFLKAKGITDFKQYRCDPDCEPARIATLGGSGFERGLVDEVKSPVAKL